MGIERPGRRALLLKTAGMAMAVAVGSQAHATGLRSARLLAAWDEPGTGDDRHRVGLIDVEPMMGRTTVCASIAVPTRAHGLVWEAASATALAVARRPGDWMLRWRPGRARGATQWLWSPPQRRFNGHALCVGERVFTTETDFDAEGEVGHGVVVMRDAASLRELALWPTHGRDPHALLWSSDDSAQPALWVANGGIATDINTGRSKDLRAMDSSLVQLDIVAGGALRGQWRLDDARLSLRHLARAADGSIGIALQAEHEDAALRAAAPLLAVWRDGVLRTVACEGPAAGGYGGDIAALGERYFVSATRTGQLLSWSAREGWASSSSLDEAGALAVVGGRLWCGAARGWVAEGSAAQAAGLQRSRARSLRPDNHIVGTP